MRVVYPAVRLAVLAVALLLLPLAVALPSSPIYFRVLSNVAHAPVFGAFAVVILALIRNRDGASLTASYAAAFAAAVAAGGLIEMIQPFIGRGGELRDLATDSIGAAGGLALAALIDGYRRRMAALAFLGALAAILYPVVDPVLGYLERTRQFPTILDFTSRADWFFLRLHGVKGEVAALPASWRSAADPPSLRIVVAGRQWPAITHLEPRPDWSGHALLNLDLTNVGARPLTLTLRVHDLVHNNRHDDRFNMTFELAPGTRQVVSVPLTRIARAPKRRIMDLGRIAGLILFGEEDPGLAAREFYVTRVWLE